MGFTNIIKISKEFRKFSVAECKMLGKGGCGEVYRIDDETIIKVYTDGSSQETIEGKMNRAKQAFICGVPAAISYNVVDCDGKLGEYISAEQQGFGGSRDELGSLSLGACHPQLFWHGG